jgi:hypothetical protein
VDQTHAGTGSSTAPSSGATATTTQASELLIGAIGAETRLSTDTLTPGFGFTALNPASAEGSSVASSIVVWPEYQIASATGAYTASGTLSSGTSKNWAAGIVTYKAGTASTTTVASSGSPSTYSSPVTFTATVTPSAATGTVNFYDGATFLGSGTLTGTTTNTAIYATTAAQLSAGTHSSITALYLGDGTCASSTSSAISQMVNPLAVQLSGTRVYDGTAKAAPTDLSIVNNVDGTNLTLSGSGTVSVKDVGPQPISAAGAPLRVNAATGSVGTNFATTFTVTIPTPHNGNTLVAIISTRSGPNGVSSVIQAGVFWTQVAKTTGTDGVTTEIWYAPNVSSAGTSVGISLTSSTFASAAVMEYQGILASSSLDVTANNSGTSTSAGTGTTAPSTQGSELWIAGIGLVDSTYTLSSVLNSFTTVTNAASGSSTTANNSQLYVIERFATTNGTVSSGGTVSAASPWSGAIATFKTVSLVLGGSRATNYTLAGLSGSLTITAKSLTYSGLSAPSRVYDGTTTAVIGGTPTLQAAEPAGLGGAGDGAPYNVDSVSAGGTPAGTLAAKDVGTQSVTVSGVVVTGTGSGNYTITQQQTGLTQIVTAKALTVSGITALSTIYDGTTNAKLSGTAAFQAAEAAGAGSTNDGVPYNVDSVSAAGTPVGTLVAKNVGAQAVTVTGVTVTGAGSGNYTVSQQTGLTQTITPKALTVSGITAASTIYDGTTTAKLGGTPAFLTTESAGAGSTSDGKPYSVDSVSPGTATGTLAAKDVGTQAVTVTGVTVNGPGNGNYAATQQTGLTQTVTPKALTVSGITAPSTIYDGTTTAKLGGAATFQATEAAGTGNTGDGKPYSVDSVSTGGTATGTLAAKDIGTRAVTVTGVTATGTGSGNYTVTQQTGLTQTITPKGLTLSGITAASTIYDGTTTAKLGGAAAFQATEAAGAGSAGDGKPYSVDSVSAGGTAAGTLAAKDVGTQAVTISGVTVTGTGSTNYTAAQQTGLTQTITAKALTVSGITAPSTIYDGTTTAKLGGAAVFQAAEAAGAGNTSDGKPYSLDSVSAGGTAAGTLAAKDVGTQGVTISGVTVAGTGSGNYTVIQQTGLTQTITKKALTVSGITAANTIYDGTTVAKLGGTAAFQATEAAGAGTTGDGVPYDVDSVSAAGTAVGTLASKNVATQAVTISGVTVTGTGSGNYTVSQQTGLTQTITAKALTVSGITAANTIYDGTTTAKLGGTAAFLATESAATGSTSDGKPYSVDSVSPGTVTGTLAAKDVGTQNVTTSVTIAGTGSGNYVVAPQASLTQTVTAKALTAQGTLSGGGKTYDATTDATPSGAAALQGAETAGAGTTGDGKPYNGDTVSLAGTASYAFNSKDVAAATNIIASGLSLKGDQAGDYALTAPSLSATIAAKALTYSGLSVPVSKIYDATTAALVSGTPVLQDAESVGSGSTSDGAPYDVDSVSLAGTGTGAYNSKDVASATNVTFAGLSLTGTGTTNYSLTALTQAATVTPKVLTAQGTLSGGSKVYNATTNASPTGSAALPTAEAVGSGSTADGKPYTGDTVTLTGTATYAFNSKDVATATTITESGLSLSGAQAGDYSLTAPTLSAAITAKALTVAGLSFSSRIYDGTTIATPTGSATLQTAEAAGSGTSADGKPYSGDTVNLGGIGSYTYNSKDVATANTVTESGLSITGAQAGDYSLTAPSFSATITTKPLTYSGVSVPASKIYDATTVAVLSGTAVLQPAEAAGSGGTSDGVPYNVDSVSLAGTATGGYNSKDVASATNVIFTGVSLTGTGTGNYSLTTLIQGATITPKALTAQGTLSGGSKVYNATTTATPSGSAALQTAEAVGSGSTVDGKPYTGDTVTLTGTATYAFNSKDVATATAITESGLSLSGAQAGDYSLTAPTLSAAITAKALTVAGLSFSSRIYDGTAIATPTGTATLQTAEAAGAGTTADGKPYTGDTVGMSGTGSYTYNSKDVATATTINASGLLLSGAQASDYTLTTPSFSATITPKALTYSGVSVPASKIYDARTTAVVSGTAALQPAEPAGSGSTSDGAPYSVDSVSLAGTATGAYNSKDVASATNVIFTGVSLTGTGTANYSLITSTQAATVTQKALTAQGTLSGGGKVYNATTTASPTGSAALQAAEAVGSGSTTDGKPYTGDTVSLTGTAIYAFNSKDVTAATNITASGLSLTGTTAGDYSLTAPTLSAAITAKALTMTGLSFSSRIYDGTTAAAPTGTAALQAAEAAGAGTSADGKPYSGDALSLTGTAVGTYNSKDVASATTVTENGLSLSGTQAGDYTLTAPSFSATITTKALTYSGVSVPASKTYNATTAALVSGTAALQPAEAAGSGSTADGTPYSVDSVSLTGTSTGTYNSKDVATATNVTFAGVSLTGAGSGNYSLTTLTQAATVTPKTLTAQGALSGGGKVYNATSAASPTGSAALQSAEAVGSGIATDGKPYTGDTVSLTGTATYAFNSKDVTTATNITASGLSLTGATAGDYSLTVPTLSASITPKTLTVTGLSASNKTYDGTTAAAITGTAALLTAEAPGTGTTSDNKPYSGDVVTVGGTAVGTFASQNISNGISVTVSGNILGGAQGSDYVLAANEQSGLSANITGRVVQLTGLRTYDGTTAAAASSLSVANNADGTNLTLSGTAVLGSKDVGSQSISISAPPARVQFTTGVANNALSIVMTALGAAPVAGNTLVAVISTHGTAQNQVTNISQTGANWSRVTQSSAGSSTATTTEIWYATNVSAGASTAITISLANSLRAAAVVLEYSGILTASAVDVAANNFSAGTAGTSATTGTTATSAQANEVWIAGIGLGTSTATLGTFQNSFASVTNVATGGSSAGETVYVLEKLASAVGTASSGGTISSAAQWSGAIATFKAVLPFGTPLALGGPAAGNYTLNGFSGAATITPKALTVSGLTAPSAIYDGTMIAKLGGTATFLSAEAVGAGTTSDGMPYNVDSVSPGAVSGTLAAKDVGVENVTTSVAVTGTGSGNYTVSPQAGLTQTVTAKALTVSGITAASTTYDGTTTAKLGGTAAFQATETAGTGTTGDGKPYSVDSVVPGTAIGTLSAKDVGTQNVTTSVTVTGAGSGNYTVSALGGLTQTVTAKALNVLGLTAASTIYDGTTTAKLGGTATFLSTEAAGSGTTSDGMPYNVDSVSPGGTVIGTLASRNVGNEAVTLTGLTVTGTGSGNYSVNPIGLTQTVTAKALTLSGITATSCIYDGTTTAKLGGTASLQPSEAAGAGSTGDGKPYSVDSVSAGGAAAGTLAAKDVGTQAVTISGVTVTGTGSGNYTVAQQTGLNQTVTAKALTVSGITADSTIYDGTTTAKLGGTAAFQAAEAAGAGSTGDGMPYNVDSVSAGGTVTGTLASKDVGTQAVSVTGVTVTGTGSGNYTVNQQTGLTQTITAKALTLSGITAASTVYDGTTAAKLDGTAAFRATEAAGTGTTGDGKPYSVDSVAPGTATGTLAAKDVGIQNVTISVAVTGTGSGNYTVSPQADLTQTVTAKALTVSGITAASTIYDGTTTAKLGGTAAFLSTEAAGAGTTSDGMPYNVDSVSPSGTAAGTLASRNIGSQAVTLTGLTVTGTGSGNYTVTQPSLTQLVSAKALTAQGTLSGGDRVYNGTTAASPTGVAALQSIESAGDGTTSDGKPYSVDSVSLTGTASYDFNSPDVATATTITESGLSLTGLGSDNYTLTAPTLSASISKASTTSAVTSSGNPSLPGASVSFTGTLSVMAPGAGTPTGTVQFLTNGAAFGSAANLSGYAASSDATTSLPHATNTITAEYAGDGNFLGTTNTFNQVVNTPPTAGSHFLDATENTALNISASSLAGQDYDADSDSLTITSVSSTSTNGGTVSISDGTITYTPAAGFVGTDSFTYTNSDGFLGGEVQSIAVVNVRPNNVPSMFDSISVSEGAVNLHGSGIPSQQYDIQRSGNPSFASFTVLSTVTTATNGTFTYTDPGAPSPSFYRLAVHH